MERDSETVGNVRGNVDFNSHAHVERDFKPPVNAQFDFISTHTLTWSVTLSMFSMLSMLQNFNSHAHVERDTNANIVQSNYTDFNSHAHVERDKLKATSPRRTGISTHTLTWSVT